MSTFVLVHGSWHGGWCWEKVASRLRAEGHRVAAPDLPGHGDDTTPAERHSLGSYSARVVAALDAQPEPAILVGHSMGGVVVTQAAEERPAKVRALVYLCAFLPRNGESLLQLAEGSDSLVLPNLVVDPQTGIGCVKADAVRAIFYGECSDEDAAWAQARLVAEPVAPSGTPVATSAPRWGAIPRAYVECTRDRAIPIALQRRMHAASPCRQVHTLESDHSPFLAAAGEVVRILAAVA